MKEIISTATLPAFHLARDVVTSFSISFDDSSSAIFSFQKNLEYTGSSRVIKKPKYNITGFEQRLLYEDRQRNSNRLNPQGARRKRRRVGIPSLKLGTPL